MFHRAKGKSVPGRVPARVAPEVLEPRRLFAVLFDSDGFEPPRYEPGPLEDQDPLGPWQKTTTRTGVATVQTTQVESGTQAVRMTRPAAPDGDTRYGVVEPIVPEDELDTIRVSWDMNVSQNTQGIDFGPFFGVEAYDGFGGSLSLIGSLGVDATTGDVLYQDGTTGVFTETGFNVQLGTWNHFELVLDYASDTYTVYVNGDDKATTGFVDDPIVGFTDAPLAALAASAQSQATATGTAFFDNYRIDVEQGEDDEQEGPKVTQVYASSSFWNQTFRDYLEDRGFGDERYGYAIPARDQLRELPWDNLDTISIRFSEEVLVDFSDLQIRGVVVPNYTLDPASFRYDADTRTATWRLAGNARFRADRIILDLDGDSPNGVRDAEGNMLDGEWQNPPASQSQGGGDRYPSGDGTPGGDFRFRVDILPGDADRNFERVNANDVALVRSRQNRTATETPPAGVQPYSPFVDLNGDGRINAVDVATVRARQNTSLPATELQGGVLTGVVALRRAEDLLLESPLAL